MSAHLKEVNSPDEQVKTSNELEFSLLKHYKQPTEAQTTKKQANVALS